MSLPKYLTVGTRNILRVEYLVEETTSEYWHKTNTVLEHLRGDNIRILGQDICSNRTLAWKQHLIIRVRLVLQQNICIETRSEYLNKTCAAVEHFLWNSVWILGQDMCYSRTFALEQHLKNGQVVFCSRTFELQHHLNISTKHVL